MSKTEGIKVKGFYRLRLIDKDNNEVVYENHNFVTNNIKKTILADSLSKMFKMNLGNPYGLTVCLDNSVYTGYTSSGAYLLFNSLRGSNAILLLDLDDSVSMDSTTKYLDIIAKDGSGVDYSKVTGYSTGKPASTNSREGVLQDITSADMMPNQYQITNSYVFDLDKANGSFNWLAIAPAFEYSPYRGIMTFKCISNYNIRGLNNSYKYGYVRPGVSDSLGNVITGPNEILTFEDNGSNSRWIYNLVTGQKRAVEPSELAYSWNANSFNNAEVGHQLVIGDYVYVIVGSTLYKVRIADGSQVNSVTIGYSGGTDENPFGMYYDGTNIICSSWTSSTTENRAYVSTVNPDTMSRTIVNNNVFTGWGNLPAEWIPRQCCFTKLGDYYLVQNIVLDGSAPDMKYSGAVIVCTDLTNVCGTIVGIMPTRGMNSYVINDAIWTITEIIDGPIVNIRPTDGSSSSTQYNYSGIYISNFEFSNFWSAAKLDQRYTKTENIKAIIDYGYMFE